MGFMSFRPTRSGIACNDRRRKLIDSAGTKDRAVTSAVVPLKAGYHRISLGYGHHGGNAVFRVRYGIKGQGLRAIGGGELAH